MATIAKLSVMLSANTAAFTDGMDKAARSTRSFSKGIDLALLKGGAAAAGLTFAFKKLNTGIEHLDDVVGRYTTGQITANEAIEEGLRVLARSVPIFGEAFKAGEKLGEMYANLSSRVRAFNADIAKQEAKNAKFAATWKIYEKAAGDATSTLQGLTRELAVLQASDAGGKAALQAAFAYEDAMKKADGLRGELAKIANTPVFAKRREELAGQIADIEATATAITETQRKLAEEAKKAPVSQAIQDLVREVEEFGVPAFDRMRKQVLDTFGPESAAFVDRYKAKLDQLEEGVKQREAAERAAEQAADDAARAREKLMDEGQRVFEATRTDMEKREAELTRLSNLLNAGAIDWDTYSRAVKQANEALRKTGSTVPENPAAQVVRFTQGMPSGARPMSELEKINKQQVDLQKKQLDTLKRIDSKTGANAGGVVIGTEALA